MICPQCGTQNAPGDKFCEQCGTPLGSPGSETIDDAAATMVGTPPASAVLVRSDDPGQTFPLGNRVVVGRLDTCDIPIHDKSVSREHARLSQLPGGYVVEDLGSTNGTMVNGETISEAVILRPGDSVTFGSIDFRFEEEGAQAAPTADVASTQPFQYRPAAQPLEDQTASAPPEAPAPAAQEESAPSIDQGVPAFDFPPLQPLPAAEEPQVAAVESNSQHAEPGAVPVSTAPPDPVSAFSGNEPTASTEPTAEPAAEPQTPLAPVSPIPSPPEANAATYTRSSEAGASSALPDDVVAAAAHLNNLVQSLAQQAADSNVRLAEAESRARDLESRAAKGDAAIAAVRGLPTSSVDTAQLESLRQTLDQLAQNPRDIELLMQVGRQAPFLVTLLGDYSNLRDGVEQAAGAANS